MAVSLWGEARRGGETGLALCPRNQSHQGKRGKRAVDPVNTKNCLLHLPPAAFEEGGQQGMGGGERVEGPVAKPEPPFDPRPPTWREKRTDSGKMLDL